MAELLEELKKQKDQVIERVHAGDADPAEVRGLTEERLSIVYERFRMTLGI